MKTGEDGLDLITRFEGFSSGPYLDPIGIPTIGYGSTWDANGDKVTMEHAPVTEEEARALLRQELRHVEGAISKLVSAPLTQEQFDALASFAYNVGTGNLQRSTMRMKINRGDYEGAADEFPKWRRAGGKILAGLVRRRAAERSLWLS